MIVFSIVYDLEEINSVLSLSRNDMIVWYYLYIFAVALHDNSYKDQMIEVSCKSFMLFELNIRHDNSDGWMDRSIKRYDNELLSTSRLIVLHKSLVKN
jgi:hypothetical protein